jgi:hypothetical protein
MVALVEFLVRTGRCQRHARRCMGKGTLGHRVRAVHRPSVGAVSLRSAAFGGLVTGPGNQITVQMVDQSEE